MIYIGDDKKMRYETSPELSSRHPDIFTNDFRKGYVEVIRQEMVKRSSNAARRYQRQSLFTRHPLSLIIFDEVPSDLF